MTGLEDKTTGCILIALMYLVALYAPCNYINASPDSSFHRFMEEKLQSQINLRAPSSYAQQYGTEILTTRPDGHREPFQRTLPNGQVLPVTDYYYESYARLYEYRKRVINGSCPMPPQYFAVHADWALLVPCLFTNLTSLPMVFYVHNWMLPHFVEQILPNLAAHARFVLVSSGTDLTIPRSRDARYIPLRGFSSNDDGGVHYQTILNHPMIIHWFCENHDMVHPKISTLPTGYASRAWSTQKILQDIPRNVSKITTRPLKILVSDKSRTGQGQWSLRGKVVKYCQHSPLCITPHHNSSNFQGVPYEDYLQLVASVPFVACVRGGGIDPSPKAWEAILVGSIPIIENSTLIDAYGQLPVLIIDNWSSFFSSAEKMQTTLEKGLRKLAPYYEEDSPLRKTVLEKLQSKHWLDEIRQKANSYYNEHKINVSSFQIHPEKEMQARKPKSLLVSSSVMGNIPSDRHSSNNNNRGASHHHRNNHHEQRPKHSQQYEGNRFRANNFASN